MKGVQFIVDDAGKKTAVVISLEEWGELWEDIYDILVSESRRDEPTVPWEELKAEMMAEEQTASDEF
jgi:PHD/YefM family antitoxin component YafN of YafNO toxin-antitoxin module